MTEEQTKLFKEILRSIRDEDYELCDVKARDFLKDHYKANQEALKEIGPYIKYFKLFAGGYRTWQISYNYTHVRAKFQLAFDLLIEEQKAFSLNSPDHQVLRFGFEKLSGMLKAYTWCENSFINNDPFALDQHSSEAIQAEEEALDQLGQKLRDDDLDQIREGLKEYFRKNIFLHTGLKACATFYRKLLQNRGCPKREFEDFRKTASLNLNKLSELSAELSSELKVHIFHLSSHYHRLANQEAKGESCGFLKVTKGKIILSLSAGCSKEVVENILSNSYDFEYRLTKKFKDTWGIEVDSFRPTVVHDIFQTSFGQELLRSLQFGLGEVHLRFLDRGKEKKPFVLDTHAELSAMGVCTVNFTLNIGSFENGLTIEEVRAIQSLICPHAGQVELSIPANPSQGSQCDFELIERSDLAGVRKILIEVKERICEIAANSSSEKLPKTFEEFKEYVDTGVKKFKEIEQYFLGNPDSGIGEIFDGREDGQEKQKGSEKGRDASKRDNRISELEGIIIKVKQGLNDLSMCANGNGELLDFFASRVASLSEACDNVRRLTRLAMRHLHGIELAFSEVAKEPSCQENSKGLDLTKEGGKEDFQTSRIWHLGWDRGWHSYLYAIEITRVDSSGETPITDFKKIEGHPDMPGFLIESREARASFDDWRFMKISPCDKRNLALIRSHTTDAFFASEFNAFMYLPDDPQFLTDQYEKTIEMMQRLRTVFLFCSTLAEYLEREAAQLLGKDNSDEHLKDIDKILRQISKLRIQANIIQNLIAKTGFSRYRDHGELLIAYGEELNLNGVVGLIDRQLTLLDALSNRLFGKLEDKKNRQNAERQNRIILLIMIVTTILTASGLRPFFDQDKGLLPQSWEIPTYIIVACILVILVVLYINPNVLSRLKRKIFSVNQ